MRTIRLLFALALFALLISCAQVAKITDISIDPATANIDVGGGVHLTAEVKGVNNPILDLEWSSRDETKATVDDGGYVTGLASGNVDIIVTSLYDPTQFAEATITVADVLIDVDQASLDLVTGEFAAVKATVRGSIDTGVTWSSSDTDVATVNSAGVVTAVGKGTATITVACVVDPDVQATVIVTVADVLIDVDQQSLDLVTGEFAAVKATVRGSIDTGVTWHSSDTDVATVNSAGVVTAVGKGTATITVACVVDPDVQATVIVTVADVLIDVDQQSLTLEIGDVAVVEATVHGSTDTSVTWSSSDTDVATVNSAGVITAVGEGNTTITVTSVADPTVMATVSVTVARPLEPNDTPGTATPITLDYASPELEITRGDIDYFTFTLTESQNVLAYVNAWEFGSGLDPMLSLLDDYGPIEESHDHCDGWNCSPDPLLLVELDPGTYYLAVESEPWDDSFGWYNLSVGVYSGSIPEVAPQDLYFEVIEGMTAEDTFTLSNNGEGTLEFDITEEYDNEYIAFSPDSGTVPAGGSVEITVSVDATDLSAYNWLGTEAMITTNSPIVPELRVWINVEVRPALLVEPDWLELEVDQGETAESSFTLRNVGLVDFDFDVTPSNSDGFLTFTPDSGTLTPGGSVEIIVTVDASVRSSGWHYDDAVISYTSTFSREKWVGIQVRIVGAPDLYEPNNATSEAIPITLDFVSPELTITPSDDDYFVFTLAETLTVTADVDASEIGSSLDPMLGLFDEFGSEIETNDDYNGLDSWIQRTLDAGTYYVVVSGCCSFGSHGQDGFYLLNVTATP